MTNNKCHFFSFRTLSFFLAVAVLSGVPALANLNPKKISVANTRKTNAYKKEGLITGGDRTINDVIVKDLRHAIHKGFERVVLDLTANRDGASVAIPRPPYFQVAVHQAEATVLVSVWGNPRLELDTSKTKQVFKKSKLIKQVVLLPQVEDQLWTFILELEKDVKVESFELSNPVRIILDIHKS